MKLLSVLLFCVLLIPALLLNPALQASSQTPASGADEVAIPIIDEVHSKGWCSMRPEPGPVVDEETFKKVLAIECFSFLKKLKVDFNKQSLIHFDVRGDCFVRGAIKITRNDTRKKYTLSVTKFSGGCRAAGSFQGWVVIEKLRPDHAIESVEREKDEDYRPGL